MLLGVDVAIGNNVVWHTGASRGVKSGHGRTLQMSAGARGRGREFGAARVRT